MVHATISEAYHVLGIAEDSTLEVVKNTYKQLALKTHPDRNPNDENATAQFQRLSEAYSVLVKHLDRSSSPPRGYSYERSYDSYSFDDYDGHDYYDDDSDDDYDDLEFYRFLYEELLRGRASRFSSKRFYHRHYAPPETQEQYEARMKRMREEQEQDKARRAREEAARKAEQEAARIRERQEAERRQKEKAFNKRVQAAASQREAEEKARIQQQRVQSLRSETFAAARRGDAEKVKKNIWENNVDAAGGEYKQSSDFPAGASAVGRQETLMHIAVSLGDLSLVEWLDSHGAEAEERDSEGRTAFHIALQQGRISIIQYFFKMYPHHDDDSAALYNRPESISLLRLAIDSREPGAVWMILENRLATKEDMSETWEYINSAIGKTTLLRTANQHDKGKYDEIYNLLICYGGFQLPGGQDSELKEQYEQFTSGPLNSRDMPSISEVTPALKATESQKEPSSSRTHANVPDNDFQHRVKPHRGQNRSRRPYTHYHQPHPTNTFPGTPQSPLNPPGHHDHSFFNGESNLNFTHSPSEGRGRGRGRGRGHGRARGRGHGRGQPSQ